MEAIPAYMPLRYEAVTQTKGGATIQCTPEYASLSLRAQATRQAADDMSLIVAMFELRYLGHLGEVA